MNGSHSEGIHSTPPGHGPAHGVQSSHGHGASHHDEKPFNDAEIARFQREDRYAGGAVVVLMTTIFSIGVVLYTIVLLSVI